MRTFYDIQIVKYQIYFKIVAVQYRLPKVKYLHKV